MAVTQGTEAYDLSLLKRRQSRKTGANKKAARKSSAETIQSAMNTIATLCTALAVTVMGMMIMSRVRLTEMDSKIKSMEKHLVELQSEKVRLNDELASKTSTKSVEEYAYNVLGMQKIESSQIEYIESKNSDKAVVSEDTNKNVLEAAGSAIVKFFSQLAYLFE